MPIGPAANNPQMCLPPPLQTMSPCPPISSLPLLTCPADIILFALLPALQSFPMSFRKLLGLEAGINDFHIEVSPRTITLPKNCRAFVLYLQKGMQIIGKFESPEGTTLRDNFYRFRHPPIAPFRINNLAHCNYAWTLYSVNQLNEECFEDSAGFNIERTVKLYQMELLEKEREVQTSIKEKNVTKGKVLQLWGEIRREMKSSRSTQKCVFANQDYQIEFQLQIKNTLDFELDKMQEEEQALSLRRVKSDELRSSRNRPPPAVIQLESAPYRSLPQLKEEEINTKETIQLEGNGQAGDEFSATVKIVNPSGEEVDTQQEAFLAGTKRHNHEEITPYNFPTKKFSLLSDIIQASHEGSSSYHPDRSSSNGNRFPKRSMDLVLQPKIQQQHAEPLNKFKTLPYQSHHRLDVGDQFRRAQTAEKNLSEVGQSQIQESYLSANEKPPEEGFKHVLHKINKKWLVAALLLLLVAVIAIPHKNTRTKKPRRKTAPRH